MAKKRLDALILEQHPTLTRNQIQSFIMQGDVTVDGERITKSGTMIAPTSVIMLTHETPKYVSRGGFKLEAALDHFAIDVHDMVALDAGISTGGFTDCLLQRGAAKVYGIDVGYGQVHEKIANDARVIILEKTNLRHLTQLPEYVDLATLDLSFISLLKVIPTLKHLIKPNGMIIALIKPQFEAERHNIGKGGLVKDPLVHEAVQKKVQAGFAVEGFACLGIIPSPITGASSGNQEFLGVFKKQL